MLAAESNVTNCISVTMESSTPQKCLKEIHGVKKSFKNAACFFHHVSGEGLQALCQLWSSFLFFSSSSFRASLPSAPLLSTTVAGFTQGLTSMSHWTAQYRHLCSSLHSVSRTFAILCPALDSRHFRTLVAQGRSSSKKK